MSQSSTDRNLLFGTLALKMDFITRDELISAMKACASEKDKKMGQVLQSQGSLAEDDEGLLDSLVRRFMEIHDNNARKCLAAVTTVGAIRHDLDKIGDYLQKATDAGINNVSNPQLESSRAEDLQRQALAKAALDAQAKARVLADTLGVKLGTVHTVSASSELSPPEPRPMMRGMAMAKAAPSGNEEMGFAAGEIRYTSNISAEFDRRMEALFCYGSQYGEMEEGGGLFPSQAEIRDRLGAIARFYGNLIGVKYGEPSVVKEAMTEERVRG